MLKFSFSGADVPTAVAFVAGQCKTNLLPIYGHLLLIADAERQCLTIRGSNGAFYLSRDVQLDSITEGGAICVSAAKFADITRSVKDSGVVTVKFERDGEKLNGVVTAARSRFKIACLDAAEFPNPELCNNTNHIRFDSVALKSALDRANRTAPTDLAQKVMVSACLEFWPAHCNVISSDGHRLTKMQVAYQSKAPVPECTRLVIGKSHLSQLCAFLSDKPEREVFMVVDSGRVAVIDPVDGWRFQFSLVDGLYPEWQRVVPKPQADWTSIQVKREYLAACLSRAQILADKRQTVSLALVGSEMTVTTTGDNGTEGASETLPVEILHDGSHPGFKFNVRYLLQAINGLVGNTVRLVIDHGRMSSVMDSADEPEAIQVVALLR